MAATASCSAGADVLVGVCLKWVDLRPEVDPLTGVAGHDERFFGASPADRAALELGLVLTEDVGDTVMAVTGGPAGADVVLRAALAAGVDRVMRVDIEHDMPSAVVAAALAGGLGACDVVVCGDWSVDRGSGSVPAFLAHELDAAQALGCVRVERDEPGLRAERRLDRGRRELVSLAIPAVVSVEAGSADLRRASLPAVLAADRAVIEVTSSRAENDPRVRTIGRRPYRPRSRELHQPEGTDARGRVLSLIGAHSDRRPRQPLELRPAEAADRLLDQLAGWGVRPSGPKA